MIRVKPPDRHFCSPSCERNGAPCDLCEAQRRKLREDELRDAGKPTLHVALGDMLRRRGGLPARHPRGGRLLLRVTRAEARAMLIDEVDS